VTGFRVDQALVDALRASAGAARRLGGSRGAASWRFLRERWGFAPRRGERRAPRLWIVCAAGGEVIQTWALGPALRRALPDAVLLLSTTNEQFLSVAARIEGLDACFFTPFDRPIAVRRALASIQPDLLITVESAFAPVLLAEARRRGITTMLASGTMTADYHLEPAYARPLSRHVFDDLDVVGVKDDPEIEAFGRFGVPASKMLVLGDLRRDPGFYRVTDAERAMLATRLGARPDERLFVAGSLRPGEEAILLDAWLALRDKHVEMRLVMAPRFITQAAVVEREAAARGLGVGRVSRGTAGGADVVLLDTYGDLARVYALASVVFLGGTLVRVGAGLGQNLIEPLAHGAPVFFGPNVRRWAAITSALTEVFPPLAVTDATGLAQGVLALEDAPDKRAALRARAQALMAEGADATMRHVEAIRGVLARRRQAA
jgi:3-deoxy-D-manno-octulosonic-acid transferase